MIIIFDANIIPLSKNVNEPEIHEEMNDKINYQLEDSESDYEDTEYLDDIEQNRNNTPQRGRGRPKLHRTGKPGRPKKIYQQSTDTSTEPANVEEAKSCSDWPA